jgi:hypothetical protein
MIGLSVSSEAKTNTIREKTVTKNDFICTPFSEILMVGSNLAPSVTASTRNSGMAKSQSIK